MSISVDRLCRRLNRAILSAIISIKEEAVLGIALIIVNIISIMLIIAGFSTNRQADKDYKARKITLKEKRNMQYTAIFMFMFSMIIEFAFLKIASIFV